MDERNSQDAAPVAPSHDLVPTPIFRVGADGRLTWINAAAEQVLGRPSATVIGESFANLLPREGRLRHLKALLRASCVPSFDAYLEVPLTTHRIPAHWMGVDLRRIESADGPVEWIASAHELTGMHEELAALRRRERELSARVREASEAAQSKTEFLTALSEELRAPMNGVIGMSRLLLDSHLEGDQQTFAEVIHDSGERLLELVDNILDFSRLEAGRLEIASLDFDLRVLADAVASQLAAPAAAREIRLGSTVNHRVPSRLTGDPGRLRQVLLCLGTNAMRDTAGGEIELRVDLVEETAHRVALRFAVIMSGGANDGAPGAGDGRAVLEAFVKDDPTLIARHGASGLALAIAHRLVALMGGDLGLHFEPGRGTICWFRVPLAKQAERPLSEPAPRLEKEVALGSLRILVADDSSIARRVLVHALRGLGCACDEVEDGLEAMERLRDAAAATSPYGLALVDLDLPGLDAAALASAIHNDPALIGTPLMLITNFGRPGDASRAEAWGYSAYLVKPVPLDRLEEAIREVMRRAARAAQGTSAVEADASETGLVTRHTLAEQRRHRVRVLVVEDSPLDQLVVCSALRRMGYEPQIANDGAAAVEAIRNQAFDIVFMDVRLPELDGIEAVREIRRVEEARGCHTPVIAITSARSDEDREQCLAAGMDEFLAKPLDLEAMCATVERWMHATESGTAAASGPAVPAAPIAPAASVATAETAETVDSTAETADPTAEKLEYSSESIEEWVEAPIEQAAPEIQRWTSSETETAAAAADPSVEEVVASADADDDAAPLGMSPEADAEVVAESDGGPDAYMIEDLLADLPVLDPERLETSSMGSPEIRAMLVRAFFTTSDVRWNGSARPSPSRTASRSSSRPTV